MKSDNKDKEESNEKKNSSEGPASSGNDSSTEGNRITKDMMISEVVTKYPKAARILMSYGMHCIGCHVSGYESIEEGCHAHGMDDETIDEMVEEINKEINKVIETIELTPYAKEMIKQFAEEDNKKGYGLRITVSGGCCLTYDMEFVELPEPTEKVLQFDDIKVFISEDSLKLIKGSEIDFVGGPDPGFRINNPNTKKCGCNNN